MTKLYEIRYHLLTRRCCGRPPISKIALISAESEEEAKTKLRQKVPGARFDKIQETLKK